jgi:hypothetical protein
MSGTPTTAGNYSFNIAATDADQCPGSQLYSLNIGMCFSPTLMRIMMVIMMMVDVIGL